MAGSDVTEKRLGVPVLCLLLCLIISPSLADNREQVPPHITEPNTPTRIIVTDVERPRFPIRCTADGHPAPELQWFKDDLPVDSQDGVLTFTDFADSDEGLYQCKATNTHGTSLSVKVPLVGEKGPTINPNVVKNTTINAKLGDALSLECAETPATVPAYIRRWYLTDGSKEVATTERVGTDSTGKLRFAYLEYGDARKYTCALVPQEAAPSLTTMYYNTVSLSVAGSSGGTSPPVSQFKTGNVKATIGQDARLECFFSGNPAPTISWKDNSQRDILPNAHPRHIIEDNGRVLRIRNVQEVDEGTFTCIGKNDLGEKQESLMLNVTTPPLMEKGLSTLTIPDTKTVILPCRAKAAANEHLEPPTWYRNGVQISKGSTPDPSRYSFSDDFLLLQISNVEMGDTACFQCNVSNSEGYLFLDGYLRVISSIEIVLSPEEDMAVSNDAHFDITVVGKGDQCCDIKYEWYFNDQQFDPQAEGEPFVWQDNIGHLWFNASIVDEDTLKSWMGNYEVKVRNGYETVSVPFKMTFKDDPTPVVASGGGDGMWWIWIIVGIVILLIAIIIIIIILKMNYPRDTYALEKTELKHHLNPEEDLANQSFQEI